MSKGRLKDMQEEDAANDFLERRTTMNNILSRDEKQAASLYHMALDLIVKLQVHREARDIARRFLVEEAAYGHSDEHDRACMQNIIELIDVITEDDSHD